jgi:hypothetical protein
MKNGFVQVKRSHGVTKETWGVLFEGALKNIESNARKLVYGEGR